MNIPFENEFESSPEEYLRAELAREFRHECVNGRLRVREDSSLVHCEIVTALQVALGVHLRTSPCQVFGSNFKVHIRDGDAFWFYYPDMCVVCDQSALQEYYTDSVAVVAEVLSQSTEPIDRIEKFITYRLMPSLHTYILAAQDKREVTVFHRTTGDWSRTILTGDATLSIPELAFSVSLDALYVRTGL